MLLRTMNVIIVIPSAGNIGERVWATVCVCEYSHIMIQMLKDGLKVKGRYFPSGIYLYVVAF